MRWYVEKFESCKILTLILNIFSITPEIETYLNCLLNLNRKYSQTKWTLTEYTKYYSVMPGTYLSLKNSITKKKLKIVIFAVYIINRLIISQFFLVIFLKTFLLFVNSYVQKLLKEALYLNYAWVIPRESINYVTSFLCRNLPRRNTPESLTHY